MMAACGAQAPQKPAPQPAFRRAMDFWRARERRPQVENQKSVRPPKAAARAAPDPSRSAPDLLERAGTGKADQAPPRLSAQKRLVASIPKLRPRSTSSDRPISSSRTSTTHASSYGCYTDRSASTQCDGDGTAENEIDLHPDDEVENRLRPALTPALSRGGPVAVWSSLKAYLSAAGASSSASSPRSAQSSARHHHRRSLASDASSPNLRRSPRDSQGNGTQPSTPGRAQAALDFSEDLRSTQWLEVETRWQAELCIEKKASDAGELPARSMERAESRKQLCRSSSDLTPCKEQEIKLRWQPVPWRRGGGFQMEAEIDNAARLLAASQKFSDKSDTGLGWSPSYTRLPECDEFHAADDEARCTYESQEPRL